MRFMCCLVSCLLQFLLVFCCLSGCSSGSEVNVTVHFVTEGGSTTPEIKCEVAATEGERRLGLMYRKSLASDSGMLFVFPEESERSFWMKNTYIELDIIFIDSSFEVVSVVHRAVPHSQTPRTSEGPARYVLEVRGGSAESWGVGPGSRLVVQGQIPAPQ